MSLLTIQCENISEKGARKDLVQAKQELEKTRISESNAVHAKTVAEWQLFKAESDNDLARMESQVTKINAIHERSKSNANQNFTAEITKVKDDIESLKGDLKRKDASYESDMKSFGTKGAEENELFRRNFTSDILKTEESIKNLFITNKK